MKQRIARTNDVPNSHGGSPRPTPENLAVDALPAKQRLTFASPGVRRFTRWISAVAPRIKNHRTDDEIRTDAPPLTTRLPKISSAVVVSVSLLVFAGWVFDVEFLKRVIPDAVAMNPMTAVAFILSSTGLWLSLSNASDAPRLARIRRLAFMCTAAVVLIGLVTLLRYTVGWDAGLDRILFASKLATAGGDLAFPNQMAPNTALNFLLAGTALLLGRFGDKRLGWLTQGMLLFVILISFLAFLGHTYDAHGLYRISSSIGMAVNTAVCFIVLGMGILAARTDQGPMAVVASPHMGGLVARRLLPVAFLLPVTVGWIRLQGQHAGFYDTEFGLGLMVATSVILLTLVILGIAVSLNRTDAERKRAEEGLRRSEADLKNAQRLAGIGNWKWDLRTDRHTWSEEIYRIYGRDPNLPPAVYPEVQAYFTPESWTRLSAAVETAMAQGMPYECDAEVVHAEGSHRWIMARGEATRAGDGTVMELHGTVQDITERKHAEEEIRRLNVGLERKVEERTAELEAANQELEAFSYSVSHDLRAPLRSIDGFSQVLLEDYANRLDEPGRQHLARVRAATVRMGDLIDDMLQLSRITRADMHHEAVDLGAMADEIMADLKRTEPGRQVEVIIQPGLKTEGDVKLLRIALVNLLANAWKFTGRKPAARIELAVQDHGSERAFYVRDNGAGFDMGYAGKLFGAFQRLHAPSEFPGTGIGLATVQRIIHRHGGRVWAEGVVNQGATFYFALPPHYPD